MYLEVLIPNTSLHKRLIGRRGMQVSPSLLKRRLEMNAKYYSWCLLQLGIEQLHGSRQHLTNEPDGYRWASRP